MQDPSVKVNDDCKLVIENVPLTMDKEILMLIFESQHFCGRENEVVNIVEKEYVENKSKNPASRLIIIEYKNNGDVTRLIKLGSVAIHSNVFKIKPYTTQIGSLPPWELKENSTANHFEIQNKIKDNVQVSNNCKSSTSVKEIGLVYPFKFLSKNKNLSEKLKHKLENQFDAEFLIKSNCYEIKRQKLKRTFPNGQDDSDTWLKRLNEFLDEFEKEEFEKRKITKNDENNTYWRDLEALLVENSTRNPEINLNLGIDEIEIEGTKEAVKKILQKLNDFEVKSIMQIRQAREKMTLLRDDLPQDLLKMITKENFIQICKDHDKELKIKFQIEKNSILFEGLSKSIQYATERLNNFIGSLRKEKFQLDWYIVDFLNKRNDFIEEFLAEQKLNCIICIEEFNEATREMIPIEIVSIKPHTTQKCLDLIRNSFKSVKYEFHQNSEELISNLKFERFVADKSDELKLSQEDTHFVIRIETKSKQIICTGEKLLVDRLLTHIHDFFDANTFYSKYYSDYIHEDLEFFRKVIKAKLERYSEKTKTKFQFEVEKVLKESTAIEKTKLNVTTTKNKHERFQSFLEESLKEKRVEIFKLKDIDVMDFFYEPKGIEEILNLEKTLECVIFSPIQLDYFEICKSKQPDTAICDGELTDQITNSFIAYYYTQNSDNIEIKFTEMLLPEYNGANVICCFLNKELEPENELSNLIVDMAGPEVKEELRLIILENENTIIDGQVYITTSGNLKNFKCIIFAIVSLVTDSESMESIDQVINNCVFNVLSECDFRQTEDYNRIAFSIFDSFNSIQQNEYLTNMVLNALASYFANACSSVKSITFVESSDQSIQSYIQGLTEKSKMPNSPFHLKPKSFSEPTQTSIKENNNIARVIYGSICDDTIVADVLVNSTNSNLDLKNGILSKTILKLGGQTIQDELNLAYPNGIKYNEIKTEIAVSGVGNLKNKKKIFHTVLPHWDPNDNQKSHERVKNIIKNILDEVSRNTFETICFPALGTGNLKYPTHQIPALMFQAFNEYFSITKVSTIKNVLIVVYHKDTEVLNAFKNYSNSIPPQKEIFNNFFTNFNLSKSECSLLFGEEINVSVYCGDITKSACEVIFNPTSYTLEMSGKVSKALLNEGGANLLNEINVKKSLKLKDGFCLTSGGDLKCKSVIHFDVSSCDIKTSVFESLKALNKKKFKSLEFPCIGTGLANSKAENCIEQIVNGIIAYAVSFKHLNLKPNLKQINVCIHTKQEEFLKHFIKLFSNLNEKKHIDDVFLQNTSQLLQLIEPEYMEQEEIEKSHNNDSSAFLKIISDSKEKLEKVKKEIDRIVSSEIVTDELSYGENFRKIDSSSRFSIENICKSDKTKLKWEKDGIKVTGRPNNVNKCIRSIQNFLTNHLFDQNKIAHGKLTAFKVQWEYLHKEKWISYDLFMNSKIEDMFTDNIRHKEITNENNVTFIFDLINMVQIEKLNPNNTCKIQRVNLDDLKIAINLPNNWLSNNHQNIINLENSSFEYNNILKIFNDTGAKGFIKKVLSIHRIQNKRLYIQYQTQKEQFEKNGTSKSNEMKLFHGTSEDCVQKIWINGFNRNYAGKHATAYGRGVYFAKNSSYSHGYTDKKSGKVKGHMFLANVLVGSIAQGSSTMAFPPNNADTTVNALLNPEIFVIYHDAQAYPEYLLTYE